MRRMRFVGLRFVLFGIVFAGVMGLADLGPVEWRSMPPLLGLPAIESFWQALGLLLLSRLLFWAAWADGGRGCAKPASCAAGTISTPQERQRFRRAMGPCGRPDFAEGEAPEKA